MPKIIAAGVGLPLIGTGATVTTSQPLLNLTQTWNNVATTFTGLKLNVTDTASASGSPLMDLQVGGTSKFSVAKTGEVISASDFWVRSNAANSGVYLGSSGDVFLTRDAANTLALRNGTAAQVFNVYNTYTDASNYERGGLAWSSNNFRIGTYLAGTGVARPLLFDIAGSNVWTMTSAGNFVAGVDNNYDIGAIGANRPRNIYLGGNITATGYNGSAGAGFAWATRAQINSPADSQFRIQDNAGTNSVTLTVGAANLLTLNGGLKTTGATFALQTATTLTDNAAAQVATMTNGPAAGNPTKWIAINDNGVTRYLPCW